MITLMSLVAQGQGSAKKKKKKLGGREGGIIYKFMIRVD